MGGSQSVEDGAKKKADAPSPDGYEEPQVRRRARQQPKKPEVLTDADAAAFDPTADKYDYLIVFANERPKKRRDAYDAAGLEEFEPTAEEKARMMSWRDVEQVWFQAIPGEEEKKNRGCQLLKRDWEVRFGKVEDPRELVPRHEVLALAREHVVDLLSRRSGLQLKLSLPADSQRRVYCQVRAPISLLERKADMLDYKFKFRDEVDPGPEFWRRSSTTDRLTGRPVYAEILEEQTLYDADEATETLEQLYKLGKIGPSDAAIYADAEPSKKHWSRRIHTLERIVDRVPVSNQYPAYAPFDANPKERHLYDEYPSVRGRTLFLPKDRLYLTKRIVDEVLDFGVLKERELVECFIALHDANYGEMPTTDWFQKRWVFFWNGEADRVGAPYLSHRATERGERCPYLLRPWAQPLMEVRSYFGEKVALYFAWLAFYGYYLMMPAVVGLVAMAFGADDAEKGIHYDQFVVAVFVVAWSAYYKESWDIESQYCAVKWGTVNFEEEEVDRPQFVGDEDQPRRISPITNQNETYYPPERRRRMQLCHACVIFACVVVLVAIVVFIFQAQEFFTYSMGGLFAYLGTAMSGVQSLLIQIMSYGYGIMATTMNDWENYQTQTAYDNNLIVKKFCFEIFNNYSALAITAFFKGPYFKCTLDDCLADLQSLLWSIMATRYALNLLAAFKPRLVRLASYLAPPRPEAEEPDSGDEDDGRLEAGPPAEAPRFEAELKLDEYEGMFDDYAEIVLQMGLVTMFTLGLYVVPLLAAGEVLLQIRVDAHKLCAQCQRPDPMPAETVGSWGMLMESMGLLAVYSNAAIIVFTTHSLNGYAGLQKVIVFFVLSQLILVVKMAIHAAIDDEPTRLWELKRRQAFVVNRHKNVVFDDDDDAEGGAGPARVDADALSVAALRTEKMNRPTMLRLEYLRKELLLCDKESKELQAQYKAAQAAEDYREALGVSYSRQNPDLALGMVSLKVVAAVGVGSANDEAHAENQRLIVHIRDTTEGPKAYEGAAGPAPQVSRPARRARPDDVVGARLVFDQHFSLAPVKTAAAEVHLEVVDESKKNRRGFARLPLSDLADQKYHEKLQLPLQRPGTADGLPATLEVEAQFKYSKVVPIRERIEVLLERQRMLHVDVTNLQIGQELKYEDEWNFPDKRDLEDAEGGSEGEED